MTHKPLHYLLLIGLTGGGLLLSAAGQDNIADLRKEIDSLRQMLKEQMPSALTSLQIHGFAGQGWLHTSKNNWLADSRDGSFEYTEVGINAMTNLSNDLRVGIQLLAYDLGEAGNLKVKVDWAYGDYNVAQWLGIRAGRVKMPMGMYNETRDTDALRVPVLLPQSTYTEIYRDLMLAANGAQLYGHVSAGPVGALSYQAWIGGMDVDSEDAGLRRQMESSGLYTVNDLDVRYVWGGALDYEAPLPTAAGSLRLTGSHMRMKDFRADLTTTETGNWALGYYYVWPPFPPIPTVLEPQHIWSNNPDYRVTMFGAEYTFAGLTLAAERQQHSGANYVTLPGTTGPNGTDIPARVMRRANHQLGYYFMGHYEVREKKLWVGASYGRNFIDGGDQNGDAYASMGLPKHAGYQLDTCAFGRYDVTSNWSLKIEHHWMQGTAHLLNNENLDNYGTLETSRSWKAWLLKTSYYF